MHLERIDELLLQRLLLNILSEQQYTRMIPLSIQGCLPTSANHQPASIAIIDAGPPKTISQR